ncbi:hypothetical protein HUN01_04540 [Nostoc edaphicum CCNP1411]|uniref:Uncharacterized protein n=1 Tax=Nostoc edaphicum CCNP1411 TaxID=1472755 RepID=A0A7D7L8M1_9NOSO|nr:hypothetical protein [Nostoc edaphicum]QMS86873.1 hypothetical protein HUN01_04540 [Nostoc edaphicum CCNP1411]
MMPDCAIAVATVSTIMILASTTQLNRGKSVATSRRVCRLPSGNFQRKIEVRIKAMKPMAIGLNDYAN